MPVLMQQDVFSRVGAIGSQWTEFQSAFNLDGDVARPQSAHGAAPTYTPLEYRATFDTFDPKASLPQPTIVQPPPGMPVLDYSASVLAIMPSTLPPVGKELEIGVSMLSTLAATSSTYELSYVINSTPLHFLRLIRRDFNAVGATTNKLLLATFTPPTPLTAGQSATITLRVIAQTNQQFFLQGTWSVDVGLIFLNYTLSGNVNALAGYCGIFLRQEGPNVGSGSNLSALAGIDNFNVRDERLGTSQPFFPMPTLATVPVLASASLPVETQPSGTLTVEPSYALPVHHRVPSREYRAESGHVVTTPFGTKDRRTWEFVWSGLTLSQRNTVEALAHQTFAGEKDFAWTDPETGEVLRLRALEGARIEQPEPNVYVVSMLVEEVFV